MNKIINKYNVPTFKIGCFIIPNLPHCYSADKNDGNAVCGAGDYFAQKCFVGTANELKRVGIDPMDYKITNKTMWIQVWLHGLGRDNLTDGKVEGELGEIIKDMDDGNRIAGLLPAYLPEEFLKDVEEGSTKTTYITKWIHGEKTAVAKIEWEFKQFGYRYARFGAFGKLFRQLVARARAFRIAA